MKYARTHYHILQIQPDADPEVVDAAYRKLCKKHHPDVNPGHESEERIRQLNAAYHVLGDPAMRRVYDEQLVRERSMGSPLPEDRHMDRGGRGMHHGTGQTTVDDRSAKGAANVLVHWFEALRDQQWHKAWNLISDADRRRIPKEEFVDWQEAVSELFRLGDVSVTVFRTHQENGGPSRIDFVAEGMEVDLLDNEIREMKTVKTVLWNRNRWQVALAYEDVRGLTTKFRLMADSRNVRIVDQGALVEMLRQEAYRAKRFADPLSIAAVRLVPPPGHEEVLGMWDTKALNWMSRSTGRMRMSDMIARLDDGLFLFILPCTNALQAQKVIRKIEQMLEGLADSEGSTIGFRSMASEYDGKDEQLWLQSFTRQMA